LAHLARIAPALYAGWSGPLAASAFLQGYVMFAAQGFGQKRRRRFTPPQAFDFIRRNLFVPPPMRGHVACSGYPHHARAFAAGKRRARALTGSSAF